MPEVDERPVVWRPSLATFGLILQIIGTVILVFWCFGVIRSAFPWQWFSIALWFAGSLL